jgi:hypothetical protein
MKIRGIVNRKVKDGVTMYKVSSGWSWGWQLLLRQAKPGLRACVRACVRACARLPD